MSEEERWQVKKFLKGIREYGYTDYIAKEFYGNLQDMP